MGTAYPKPPTPVSKTLAKSKTNGILNTKELTMAEVMEIIEYPAPFNRPLKQKAKGTIR